MPTLTLEVKVSTNDLDLSTKQEPHLDLEARIAALKLGFNSVRHFEIAAKNALIQAAQTPTPAPLKAKRTPAKIATARSN